MNGKGSKLNNSVSSLTSNNKRIFFGRFEMTIEVNILLFLPSVLLDQNVHKYLITQF